MYAVYVVFATDKWKMWPTARCILWSPEQHVILVELLAGDDVLGKLQRS